jgi:HAD superfamily hydrolase (TIGR01509 family)
MESNKFYEGGKDGMNNILNEHTSLVIFDMDGLMFDTEKVSFQSFIKSCEFYGYALDEITFRRTIGVNLIRVKEIYQQRFGKEFPFDMVLAKKLEFATQYMEDNGVPIKEGLYELLDFLAKNKIKKAVATSSNRKTAMHLLALANVLKSFDYALYGDELKKSKPEPDIFLAVAKRMNCLPENCIVLEDSPLGVLAGSRAGMKVIMIPDLLQPDKDTQKLLFKEMKTLLEVEKYFSDTAI